MFEGCKLFDEARNAHALIIPQAERKYCTHAACPVVRDIQSISTYSGEVRGLHTGMAVLYAKIGP